MQVRDPGSLADYLEGASELEKAFGELFPDRVRLLAEFDRNWGETLAVAELTPLSTGMLVLQAVSIWRCGVRIALSGHTLGAFPVLRTSLEASCYAYLIARNPELDQVWMHRDTGEVERKRFGKVFRQGVDAAVKQLRADRHEYIAASVGTLYEAAITFGAHPNPKFLWSHTETYDEASETGSNAGITELNAAASDNAKVGVAAAAEHALLGHALTILATGAPVEPETLDSFLMLGRAAWFNALDFDLDSDLAGP